MNEAGRRAIQQAIDYLKDNKYRYEMAMRNGLGRAGDDLIIREHERKIAELKENFTCVS